MRKTVDTLIEIDMMGASQQQMRCLMYRFTLRWTTKFVGGTLEGCTSESMARMASRKAAKMHIDFLKKGPHNSATSTWVAENIRLEEIV